MCERVLFFLQLKLARTGLVWLGFNVGVSLLAMS
jgi:hypothetical protein